MLHLAVAWQCSSHLALEAAHLRVICREEIMPFYFYIVFYFFLMKMLKE